MNIILFLIPVLPPQHHRNVQNIEMTKETIILIGIGIVIFLVVCFFIDYYMNKKG